jgi:peroxiredoxin
MSSPSSGLERSQHPGAATGRPRSDFGLRPPGQPAPEWTTREWFNTAEALQLAGLRGQVVVVHAFQMLCPACVHHGLPQAQRIHSAFAGHGVAVIGLHTVFEHHAAMTPVSLQAFLHEYRVGFPVGVDAPSPDGRLPIPVTMQAYAMQGTPTLLLIDHQGHLRQHAFGAVDDLRLGAAIATLVAQSR